MRLEKKSIITSPFERKELFDYLIRSKRIHKTFPDRWIYSLYYDDHLNNLAKASLNGDKKRFKIRFRFYDKKKISVVNFNKFKDIGVYELKTKDNQFVNKKILKEKFSYFVNLKQELKELSLIKNFYYKTLIGYKRSYFKLSNSNLRITLDENLTLYKKKINFAFKISEEFKNLTILETKLPVNNLNNDYENIGLYFNQNRFSKYLFSLNRKGDINYIY